MTALCHTAVLLMAVFGLPSLAVAQMKEPAPSSQERLSVPEVRALLRELMRQGRYAAARGMAEGLIAARPEDVEAHLALSRALRALRAYSQAAQAGRTAWQHAATPDDRYAAALLTAQAISAGGSKLRAQIWLRRAVEVAPNEAFKSRAIRDYRYVRDRALAAVRLSFSVAPTSNINGGSSEDRVTVTSFGQTLALPLTGDARALSGVEFTGQASLSYRLRNRDQARTVGEVGFEARRYSLSSDAKEIAPGARGSDYSFTEVTAQIHHNWHGSKQGTATGASFGLGRQWYGGSPLRTSATASVTQRRSVGNDSVLSYSLAHERQWSDISDAQDAQLWTLSTAIRHSLRDVGLVTFSAYMRDTQARSVSLDRQLYGLSAQIRLREPVLPDTYLDLSLGAAFSHYDQAFPSLGDREDTTLSLSAGLTFGALDYMGFVPRATLSLSRTESTIERYETEELGLSLGLRSAF